MTIESLTLLSGRGFSFSLGGFSAVNHMRMFIYTSKSGIGWSRREEGEEGGGEGGLIHMYYNLGILTF